MTRLVSMVMLIVVALTAPVAAEAQPAGKVYRVGVLETISLVLNAANCDAFRHYGLEEDAAYLAEHIAAIPGRDGLQDLAADTVLRRSAYPAAES
jgi:hypothetical protein